MLRPTLLRTLSASPKMDPLRLLGAPHLRVLAERALDDTGRWHRRKRRLPAPFVLSFILALALFRDRSIEGLLELLSGHPLLGARESSAPTGEAMVHARARLGWEPVRRLFERQVEQLQPPPIWNGYRVWALDGVRLTMPNSRENVRAFGRLQGSRGAAAFPQALAVCLVDVHGRRVREVHIDQHKGAERDAVPRALAHLNEGDLVTLDRGFSSAEVFERFNTAGVAFLARVTAKWKPRYIRPLARGGWLVEVKAKVPLAKGEKGSGRRTTRTVRVIVRLVEYKLKRGKRVRVVTNLEDSEVSAQELAELYWKRWECELAFDEQKNQLAVVHQARARTVLRSKTPTGVCQEIYGLLVAYNAIRTLMVEAAEAAGLDPLHLSFLRTVHLLRDQASFLPSLSPRELKSQRKTLLAAIAEFENPRPRRNRSYPRVVRRKMSNFPLKRPGHRELHPDWRNGLQVMRRRSPSGKSP